MNARRKLSPLWVLLILLGTGGCAGGSGSPAPTSAPPPGPAYGVGPTAATAAATATITIKDFAYGDPLTVAPGAAVTVTNMDAAAHTVTADEGSAFDAQVKGGGTATFTAPTKPGSYAYHCTYHPGMHGTLVVK
ncbi:Plastocyanin [Arthrobacter sp. 49Tsu3.1M3]|uniref:cupredoxin domain-containing protein n=1 Tax=Arthrobacter sp. 49Tsu3.1M3 TaxID=1279029 RepID=UPI0009A5D97B|nr:cupredoxin domain-containing protein [Arthrobacter sp. 49Tsu3.1M3]SKB31467.1 Plastocyanin [Arthrobacter sp. 49Tsu3.1M3]